MMRDSRFSLCANPEQEPYNDGLFEGFQILIVCLYMGAYEKNNQITKEVFDRDCGRVLRRKGFRYTFVCSYGEGITELVRDTGGRCPFTQLWLFSSPGYGELPTEARDKDIHKIVPFLKAVTDFWMAGGSLLLFCDNDPYTFEVNYLLSDYITFTHGGQTVRTNVRFGGLQPQGSNDLFRGWRGKEQIRVAATEAPERQAFTPKVELPPPGKCNRRLSLRPGLVTFYEGNTISYAVNPSGQPISNNSDLWPFTPFAWTSERVTPPRPFILFYDPAITSETLECRGPIVAHCGFTSAFYEFGDDKTGGSGRLLISIACWLTRMEEQMYRAKTSANPIAKSVPRLSGNYAVTGYFTGFQEKPAIRRHSILCLDVSGSMDQVHAQLAQGANDYISLQRKRNGLISIVQFDHGARILYEQGTRDIGWNEGFTGGGTNFTAPLQLALQILARNPAGYECRLLFFTDGLAAIPTTELQILRTYGIRMDVVGYGSVESSGLYGGRRRSRRSQPAYQSIDQTVLGQLATCGGRVTIGGTMDDVQAIFRAIAAAD
jgi:hypothetical protein